MDEKVLEEIRFHQDVVNKDANSPLYQIREKELEIHGRVLAAKAQAENIVMEARQKAADLVAQAETESEQQARRHAEELLAKAEADAVEIRSGTDGGVVELESQLAARHAEAVDFVISIVTSA